MVIIDAATALTEAMYKLGYVIFCKVIFMGQCKEM